MLLKVLTAIYFQTWCNMQFQSLTTMLKDHWWARFGKLLYELIGVYGMTFTRMVRCNIEQNGLIIPWWIISFAPKCDDRTTRMV